ncbi:MAG: DUF3108 domain-containing protein [Gemmatimonadetes bacterium]|nr:DUF3108 domain-containing protein [Gemmatimonadota bacterium]
MKATVVLMLAALIAGSPAAASAVEVRLSPFVAEYDVKYGNMSVGTSRTEFRHAGAPGQWVIELRSTASGLAKLVASGTLMQRSTFELDAGGVRPLSYRFDDGTRRTTRDVALDFDWHTGRVTGVAEGSAVDVPVEPDLQDAASIQAYVLIRLHGGVEPGMIAMIEKDRVKYYRYTLLRRERLSTGLGVFDTIVYRSARDGTGRETLLWYAPALGYATVRAEQRRDGKRLFQTYIKGYRPGT